MTDAPYKIESLSGSDPALKPYKNLIYASWLKSLRFGNNWFQDIESDIYYKVYHDFIDRILDRPNTCVRLAVLTDDLDVCVGWSVSEGAILHYVFVKGDIKGRKQGIGRSLVPDNITTITHITKTGRSIWKSKAPQLVFNPF